MERSRRHYAVTCTAPAGWPPLHLWAAAQAVDELAEVTGGVRLDPCVPRLLPAHWCPPRATRPSAFAVGEWLWPRLGVDDDGRHTLLTAGLARLGLPELGAEGLAPREVHPTIHLLEDLAQTLTRRLFAHVASTGLPAPLTLPARLPIPETATAWRRHCAPAPQSCGTGRQTVRLRHDRLPPGRAHRLTVLPEEVGSSREAVLPEESCSVREAVLREEAGSSPEAELPEEALSSHGAVTSCKPMPCDEPVSCHEPVSPQKRDGPAS
jgi:hypothetical protein